MSAWNYRVVEKHDGELAIHSVYYDDNGKIDGLSLEPSAPRGYGGDLESLKHELDRYLEALSKPILIDKGEDVPLEEKV